MGTSLLPVVLENENDDVIKGLTKGRRSGKGWVVSEVYTYQKD